MTDNKWSGYIVNNVNFEDVGIVTLLYAYSTKRCNAVHIGDVEM